MAESQVTHTLVGQTGMTPSFVNQNFRDVAQFVNTQTVHSDGTNLPGFLPLGVVARASITSGQIVSGTTDVDVTGLTVTFTAKAGRLYRVVGWLRAGGSTTALGSAVVKLTDGANTQLQQDRFGIIADNATRFTFNIVHYVNPVAGSVTYKLRASEASGSSRNWQIIAAADNPAWLAVEDVGPF